MLSAASLSLQSLIFLYSFTFPKPVPFPFSLLFTLYLSFPSPVLNMPSLLSFQLESLYFCILFFPLLVVLFPFALCCPSHLPSLLPNSLLSISLNSPKLKDRCHPLQGLCLRNFISFAFNYWFCADGLPQPRPCLPCAPPRPCRSLADVPRPFLSSRGVSWFSSPLLPQLLPAFINHEWYFSGLFCQPFSSNNCM